MSVKSTTIVVNKPKATVKNLQFVKKLDNIIDDIEKAEENDEVIEGNRRSSYDLVMIRSQYIDRYDWYDTIFEKNGKYGTKDATGKVLLPAKYDGIGELCHKIYCGNIPRVAKLNGKAGLVKPDGSGEALTPFVYDSISYMLIEPYYTVKKDGKLGIIGKDGHVIAPCMLDEITHANGQCLVIRSVTSTVFLTEHVMTSILLLNMTRLNLLIWSSPALSQKTMWKVSSTNQVIL